MIEIIFKQRYLAYALSLLTFLTSGCKEDDNDPVIDNNTIVYKTDGRTMQYGNPNPILLDVNEDGSMDYVLFMELTANSMGDRLYVGINPLGANLMKTGQPIDENFLSMGFIAAENEGALIDENLDENQIWYTDHGALVIRNTTSSNEIFYEGNWEAGNQLVAIRQYHNNSFHFGWLRIGFDKAIEKMTLVDFAYDSVANQPIIAGAVSN